MSRIAVIGASGRVGRLLTARLLEQGARVVAIGRNAARLPAGTEPRVADLDDAPALAQALHDAGKVVSCAHAQFAGRLLAALPPAVERVVLTGSTRRYTRIPDEPARQVMAAEEALAASGRPGVILHPTMIYGASGENNVQRVAAYIRRFGAVALPAGGRALIQPIHAEDVAACLAAALFRDEAIGPPIVVAGPEPMAYRDFIRTIAAAMDRPVRILPMPVPLMTAAARVSQWIPGVPRVTANEIRRLVEDKAFPIEPMQRRLGITARPFADGVRALFSSLPVAPRE
jgi:uncharacterized protein YbjT (DUF2867 family)